RHSYLAKLVGIRHFILAVNKMDLVDYDQTTFDGIVDDFMHFAASIGIDHFAAIPISGLKGDNIIALSPATPWFHGPVLLDQLETVPLDAATDAAKPFRMPVQSVNRPSQDFRGFAGQIATGQVKPGAEVRILPSGRTTR